MVRVREDLKIICPLGASTTPLVPARCFCVATRPHGCPAPYLLLLTPQVPRSSLRLPISHSWDSHCLSPPWPWGPLTPPEPFHKAPTAGPDLRGCHVPGRPDDCAWVGPMGMAGGRSRRAEPGSPQGSGCSSREAPVWGCHISEHRPHWRIQQPQQWTKTPITPGTSHLSSLLRL